MKHLLKKTVCLLLTLVICFGLLPVLGTGAAAATPEERQQAVVTAAMAYYDKGHSVQYDGATIVDDIKRADGGKTRSTNQVAPEYATPQETMFSVCSDFAHQVYWEAFRYSLCGSAGANWTHGLCKRKDDDPEQAWFWDAETSANKDRNVAIDELLAVAQPGDVVTSITKDGGHTMVYVGDVLGDGTTYIVHCWGSDNRKAQKNGFVDNREYGADDPNVDKRYGVHTYKDSKGGAIRLCPAYDFLHKNYGKDSQVRMNLIRPLNILKDSEYPISDTMKYRMSHPRLAIDRYLNITRFNSVYTGEQVTMTLKLSNSSKVDYSVPVTDKAPAGTKIVTPFEGATVSGDTMTWNVELKAGEEKTFTCVFEITAQRGDKIVFEGGSVGDIPSNSIPLTVGGKKLTAEEEAKLADIANGRYTQRISAAGANNGTLGDVVYQKILGLNVSFPEFKWIAKNVLMEYKTKSNQPTNRFKTAEEIAAEDIEAYQMIVPDCWGGERIRYEWGIERCIDPRDKHLEPGDVVVRSSTVMSAATGDQMVYLGNGKYLTYEKKTNTYPIVEEPEFVRCLVEYKVFFVYRPTLRYDDIHTLSIPVSEEDEFKFTDVKESDWFYSYVRDLVADGTVNGMTPTTFAPGGNLTYGQALKLVTIAVGRGEQAKTDTHWASGYLTIAKNKGWVPLDEIVNLDAKITRLKFCKIAAKAKGLTEKPETNPFKDTEDKDVLALYKAGVINGMSETEFKPDGLLTRAQISKIIWTLRKA